ncbi:MAG: di/tricarboxylate transporter [Verrucomicrobiales bacterium]|jgi:di/tricarboxylate transporter
MSSFLEAEVLGIAVQIWLVFAIVIVVAIAFFREWASPDVVALCALGSTFLFGILSTDEILGVFSNRAPITIACMFVISAALERTGAIDIIGRLFTRIAGKTELRVMLTLMVVAAVLSAFVNNTPVVVVFLPIVNSLAKTLGLNPSRLLIPLSFAAILGGTCTLTGTSTNLIIDDLAQKVSASAAADHAAAWAIENPGFTDEEAWEKSRAADIIQEPFGMFELSKIGIIYAIIGFTYIITIGRKLLPNRKTLEQAVDPPEIRNFLTQFRVEKDSPLIGKTLLVSLLKEIPDADVLEVRRRGRVLQTRLDELKIRQGDRLLLTVTGTSFEDLKETEGIRFPAQANLNLRELETRELKLMEGIVGPRSEFAGKTLGDIKFRQRFGVHILAVHRQGKDLHAKKNLATLRLKFGDTLLIEGPVDAINQLQKTQDFVSIKEPRQRKIRPYGLWPAVALIGGFVLGAAIYPTGIPAFAILAALGMIVARCIPASDAYQAVQWNIIFLIFGMLALGKAMEVSGAAALLADGIHTAFGSWAGPVIILSAVYFLSSILTELISNNAVAALLTPVIISMAISMSVDARPMIVAMMLGCSASFATPIGYQTNTYVFGAGGYRFSDFPKIGVPLNLMLWLVATLVVPLMWKF